MTNKYNKRESATNSESVSCDQVIRSLNNERQRLNNIIRMAQREIEKAPEGSVLLRRHKKGIQFYFRDNPKDKNGTYMPMAERKKAVALVQKRYLTKILAAAVSQQKAIDTFIQKYDPDALKNVYEKEGRLRQAFLLPIILPDRQYIENWQSVEYEGKPFQDNAPEHYTRKGDRVRSKSEVLIADTLSHLQIPYRYECPVKINGRIIYPDFTILRIRDRKEFYWEHLGMMDDTDYRNNAFQRIRDYEANGIFPGINLILTIETFRMPLNTAIVQRMIKQYLL